ncbi:MAG: lipoate protein ligase C-terminal domain-containing protein [Thermoproteota archaeon]
MISSGSSATLRARMLNLGVKRIEDALSVFEALSLRDRKPEAPIIIVHRNKGKSVSLGCFQIADEDFAISYLRKKNFDYFFRLHGGDVMLHDENQVGIGIIAPNDEKYKEMHASLMSLLLKRNGIRSFQVTNDYIICFNKILGEVTYLEKESLLGWFTVLYLKRSYEEIAGLKFPKEQLIKERVSKLKESCIGLDQVLGKQVSAGQVFEMVKEVLSDELNFRLSAFRLGLADKKYLWKSREMLRKNSISERTRLNYLQLKHSAIPGETFLFSKRLMNGFLRVWVRIKDRNVERVSISGSFMFEPPGKLRDFEKMLEGSPLEETSLTEKITEFFINEKIKASFTPFDIVELLCKAPGGK